MKENSEKVIFSAVCVVMMSFLSAAHADTIDKVSPNPINNQGGCKLRLDGDFKTPQGDRVIKIKKKGGNWSNVTVNTWSNPKVVITIPNNSPPDQYKVQVYKGNSSKSKQKKFDVVAGSCGGNGGGPTPGATISELCKIVDCGGFVAEVKKPIIPAVLISIKPPHIDGILSTPKFNVTPGGRVYLTGSGFGLQGGKIFMVVKGSSGQKDIGLLDVKWEDSSRANGLVSSILASANFQDIGWNDTQEGQVYFKLVTNYPRTSNLYGPMKYLPGDTLPLTEKFLPLDSPAISYSCGDDANIDMCQTKYVDEPQYGTLGESFIVGTPLNYTIYGYHRNLGGAIGYDVGDDQWHIKLANGWFVSKVLYEETKSSSNEVISGNPHHNPQEAIGSDDWGFNVHWVASPGDSVTYRYRIWIKGPTGIAYCPTCGVLP